MMSDQASDLLVSFGGHTLKVVSDNPQIATAMQTHLCHCRSEGGILELVTEFSVKSSGDSKFTISADGEPLFSNHRYDLTLQALMTELISRLVAVCERGLVFHAAALAWEDNGLILCGQSRSGKSSLAAWLTADGFQYLTDEVIEILLNGDVVRGFPRSIFLKRGSAFIWKERLPDTNLPGFLSFKDGSAWIDSDLFHPNSVTDQAAPRVLLFPQYQANTPLQFQKLTTAETLFHLLRTLDNARNLPDHGMEAVTRLAQQVTAYSLSYSELEETSAWIRETMG